LRKPCRARGSSSYPSDHMSTVGDKADKEAAIEFRGGLNENPARLRAKCGDGEGEWLAGCRPRPSTQCRRRKVPIHRVQSLFPTGVDPADAW
jgi:hypothetical protein